MNENILKLVNLASPKLGTKIIDFSDDFFGDDEFFDELLADFKTICAL